ncbi:MAG: DUF4153 domain-containing protein, partial [Sphingomonas bacterium]|nr:DUF4153 domain-containing protein [Sphingomonas bacterium]
FLVMYLLKKAWWGGRRAGLGWGGGGGGRRARAAPVAILQRLVMVVLGVLSPVLAAALVLFLASLPFTGLTKLWDSSIPATPMMLVAGAGAILLANAVLGNGADDRATNRVLRISALALVLCVLPLAIIAALSLAQRIGQYGWTPERIWGVVAVLVAIGYGLVGWLTVAKARLAFDDLLRPLQTKLALGMCGIALILALPILDFGAISASSQMARFHAGKAPPKDFDWRAMAFDFGPAGRKRLAEIARSGPSDQRKLAAAALASKDRYRVEEEVEKTASVANLDRFMRVIPERALVSPQLRNAIGTTQFCRTDPCVVMLIDPHHAMVAGPWGGVNSVQNRRLKLLANGTWVDASEVPSPPAGPPPIAGQPNSAAGASEPDLATAPVELRRVERRQLFVGGKPVGEVFE